MITESSEANVVVEENYPMILIGRDHRVSYANLRAHQLLGYEHGGLHGLSIEKLLAPSRRSEVRNVQAVLIGQAPRRWKSALRDASGASIEVHVGVEPCHDHRGHVIAVKVSCERIIRSKSSANTDFDSASGLRKIVTPPAEAASSVSPPAPAAAASSVSPPAPAGSASTVSPPAPRASARTVRPAASASSVRRPAPVAAERPPVKSVRPPPLPSSSGRPTAPAASARPPAVPSVKAPPAVASAKAPPPVASLRPPAPVAALKVAPPTAPGKARPAALRSSRPAPAIESSRPGPLIEAPRSSTAPSRASVAVRSERPRPPVHSMTLPPAVKTLRPSAPASEAPSAVTPSGVQVKVIAQALETMKAAPASAPALVLSDDCVEQLETALQLMGWLRERVSKGESLDDPRERARLEYVLTEATELVAEVRCNAKREAKPARPPAERLTARR